MEIPTSLVDREPVIVNVYDMVSHCYNYNAIIRPLMYPMNPDGHQRLYEAPRRWCFPQWSGSVWKWIRIRWSLVHIHRNLRHESQGFVSTWGRFPLQVSLKIQPERNYDDFVKLTKKSSCRCSFLIGHTPLTREEVQLVIAHLGKDYRGSNYSIVRKNCNHFTRDFCLVG